MDHAPSQSHPQPAKPLFAWGRTLLEPGSSCTWVGRGNAWKEASRWGETPHTSSPVLRSVLRAVPREGGGMAAGAIVWDSPLFGQLHMAHAHQLPAETPVPLSTPSFSS